MTKDKKVKKRKIEGKTHIFIDSDTYDLLLKIYGSHRKIPFEKKIKLRKPEDEDE